MIFEKSASSGKLVINGFTYFLVHLKSLKHHRIINKIIFKLCAI